MHGLLKPAGSLLVGAVAFLGVLVGLTELLAPHVWPAVFVSGPVAIVAGVLGAGLAYGYLTVREERAATGTVTARTRTRFASLLAGVAGFVVFGTAAVLVAGSLLAFSYLAAVLFVGLPVGLLAGVVAALATASLRSRRGPGSQSAV